MLRNTRSMSLRSRISSSITDGPISAGKSSSGTSATIPRLPQHVRDRSSLVESASGGAQEHDDQPGSFETVLRLFANRLNASDCGPAGHGSPRRACVATLDERLHERAVKQLGPVNGPLAPVEQNTIFPSPAGPRAAGIG